MDKLSAEDLAGFIDEHDPKFTARVSADGFIESLEERVTYSVFLCDRKTQMEMAVVDRLSYIVDIIKRDADLTEKLRCHMMRQLTGSGRSATYGTANI